MSTCRHSLLFKSLHLPLLSNLWRHSRQHGFRLYLWFWGDKEIQTKKQEDSESSPSTLAPISHTNTNSHRLVTYNSILFYICNLLKDTILQCIDTIKGKKKQVRLKTFNVFTDKLEGIYIAFWLRNGTKIKGFNVVYWRRENWSEASISLLNPRSGVLFQISSLIGGPWNYLGGESKSCSLRGNSSDDIIWLSLMIEERCDLFSQSSIWCLVLVRYRQ
jgi:hypothetical protein